MDTPRSPTPTDAEPSAPAYRPDTLLPRWGIDDLPEPAPPAWRNWKAFVGPSIVMMGVQIGGGEWLFGPEVTAKYGGSLLWIASVAIVLQVFYNLECGRYALATGEPILTGFFRTRPGPFVWTLVFAFFSTTFLIPGLSTHAAAIVFALVHDRPPTAADKAWVMTAAYVALGLVVLPVLFGGKVYNTLQAVSVVKVVVVLGFCVLLGLFTVSREHWWSILTGFFQLGSVPVTVEGGSEKAVNAFAQLVTEGTWPIVSLANIAVLGAFAGYAGGGGLSNSTYSNYARDKGWGMGARVGAIPSAIGGKSITLSHLGKVFPQSGENLRRWKGWWRTVLVDQIGIWMPGCFVGMALPALLSLEFAPHSPLYGKGSDWTQAMITADGLRHSPAFTSQIGQVLWLVMLGMGLLVLLPSQMSIVDDFSRRWTDAIWSASSRVREKLHGHQVNRIYYALLAVYAVWSILALYLFDRYGTPKLMTLVIANLNNVVLGVTAIFILRINLRLLPPALRPRWHNKLGMVACCVFYLGIALLVFVQKQLPVLREILGV